MIVDSKGQGCLKILILFKVGIPTGLQTHPEGKTVYWIRCRGWKDRTNIRDNLERKLEWEVQDNKMEYKIRSGEI